MKRKDGAALQGVPTQGDPAAKIKTLRPVPEPHGNSGSPSPAEGPPPYRLPRFDPAWLPAPLRYFSEALASSLGAPFEMVALKALAVPSLVAGPFVDVEARDVAAHA